MYIWLQATMGLFLDFSDPNIARDVVSLSLCLAYFEALQGCGSRTGSPYVEVLWGQFHCQSGI